MDPILSHREAGKAFNLGIIMGLAIHFAFVAFVLFIYLISLYLVRKVNLSAMGINESEFRVIHEAILRHRRRQQPANLPKEGRRTVWFKGMTLRALNGISGHEFVFLLRQAKETVRLRKVGKEKPLYDRQGVIQSHSALCPSDYFTHNSYREQGDSAWSRSDSDSGTQMGSSWPSMSGNITTGVSRDYLRGQHRYRFSDGDYGWR